MTSYHPITEPPICSSITTLDVWIAIKTVLHRELGDREWEMWIQHARLWRIMPDATLGVLVPRSGRCSFGANRYIKRIRGLARKQGFGVMLTVAHDMELFQLNREAIEAMSPSDRRDDLMEKWQSQNEWLSEPFIEPPCSPLWEGFTR